MPYTFRRRTRQREIAADGDPGNFLPTMRKRLNQVYQRRQQLYQEQVRRENEEQRAAHVASGLYSIPSWTVVHQDGNVYTRNDQTGEMTFIQRASLVQHDIPSTSNFNNNGNYHSDSESETWSSDGYTTSEEDIVPESQNDGSFKTYI